MRFKTSIWLRMVTATLLFAMVYYFAGYRLVYFMLMHGAKANASFVIKHEAKSLEILSFSVKEYNALHWTEKNKEFSYKGQLYDVAAVFEAGNVYKLKVYADKNETHWAKALNDFVKQLMPVAEKSSKNAEGFMSAFHKEYIPIAKQGINRHETITGQYSSAGSIFITANVNSDIWHPPAIC